VNPGLRPARGCLTGVAAGLLLWLALGWLAWRWWP